MYMWVVSEILLAEVSTAEETRQAQVQVAEGPQTFESTVRVLATVFSLLVVGAEMMIVVLESEAAVVIRMVSRAAAAVLALIPEARADIVRMEEISEVPLFAQPLITLGHSALVVMAVVATDRVVEAGGTAVGDPTQPARGEALPTRNTSISRTPMPSITVPDTRSSLTNLQHPRLLQCTRSQAACSCSKYPLG